MTTERLEVGRTIAADPASIFRVLSDPQGHVTIDSSGMLQSADGDPVTAVGDSFVVHLRSGLTGGVLQHAGAVDGHVALRVAQHGEDARRVRRDRPLYLDAFGLLGLRLFGHGRIVPPDPFRRLGRPEHT